MDKTEGFKKFLYNQVSLVIGIVGISFGIFNMIQAPKSDLQVIEALNNIRDNHIHTIEENVKRIDDTNTSAVSDDKRSPDENRNDPQERLPVVKNNL
jgi:hypothetical protein